MNIRTLGVELLTRSPTGVTLTVFGEMLTSHARVIEGELRQSLLRVPDLVAATVAQIAIGMSPTVAYRIGPLTIASMLRQQSCASVSLIEAGDGGERAERHREPAERNAVLKVSLFRELERNTSRIRRSIDRNGRMRCARLHDPPPVPAPSHGSRPEGSQNRSPNLHRAMANRREASHDGAWAMWMRFVPLWTLRASGAPRKARIAERSA